MRVWRITPVAHDGDTRWQDHPIWQEVVVRAETAAMARLLAGRMEAAEAGDAPPTGNESASGDTAFDDIGLYRVTEIDSAEAAELGTDGPREVLRAVKRRERRRW